MERRRVSHSAESLGRKLHRNLSRHKQYRQHALVEVYALNWHTDTV